MYGRFPYDGKALGMFEPPTSPGMNNHLIPALWVSDSHAYSSGCAVQTSRQSIAHITDLLAIFSYAVSFHTFGGEKGERKVRRKVLATGAAPKIHLKHHYRLQRQH
jgi:hypothetical protein